MQWFSMFGLEDVDQSAGVVPCLLPTHLMAPVTFELLNRVMSYSDIALSIFLVLKMWTKVLLPCHLCEVTEFDCTSGTKNEKMF